MIDIQRKIFKFSRILSMAFAISIALNISFGFSALAQSSIWSIVPSANASTKPLSSNTLNGVAAISDNNVWAVGVWMGPTAINRTLTEHWNGSSWSVVPSPNVGSLDNTLNAVSAVSSNDVWAVGFVIGGTANEASGLIEHWNGSSWSIVPSPKPSSQPALLKGVAAISANDVWVAGTFTSNDQTAVLPLIEHWNGSSWSIVPKIPTNSTAPAINAMTARSANDIWVVGDSFPQNSTVQTNLAWHWNGIKWSITSPAAFASNGQQSLDGVSAFSSTDVWAVGSYATPGIDAFTQTLAIHWNGKQWSKVTTPNPVQDLDQLFAVSAISSNDVWAVGWANLSTLIEHWNGTKWSIVPSPNQTPQGNNINILLGINSGGPGKLWAVGEWESLVQGNPGQRTLTLHTIQG
jgi:hypothetical protein